MYPRSLPLPDRSSFLFGPHGQAVNVSGIARDAATARTTVAGYLDILEGTLLRTYAEERELYDEIFFWSPPAGSATEVDFLLRRGREFLAVEVKSSARYSPALTSGLRAISDLPHLVRRILVFTGPRSLVTPEGIEVWPVRLFLDAVLSGKLWP